jgi:hypothetical protein
MSDNNIEPQPVIDVVERYVERELRDLAQYTNREPFDESGVWSLHQAARDIYVLGVEDGRRQEAARNRGQRAREREAARAQANGSETEA